MTRRISILNVIQSGANPGAFVVGVEADNSTGDWTGVFQGKFYRDALGTTQPFYSSPTPPAGYSLIEATTFTVINNASYAGRYTVYTQSSAVDPLPSSFSGAQTTIRVAEPVGAPGAPIDATSGEITNISTYYIVVSQEAPIIVPPTTNIATRPLELVGRNFSGWGEVLQQNTVLATQNFAGSVAPTAPLTGQSWYNTSNGEFRIWSGSSWNLLNGGVFSSATSYRHTQAVSATTWTINHNLAVTSPFIVNHSFFVDTGVGGVKPILPSDVTYVSANQMTATFTTAYAGYVLVRP